MKLAPQFFLLALLYLLPICTSAQPVLSNDFAAITAPDTVAILPEKEGDAEAFFEQYYLFAIELSMHFKVPATIILSVAALESGYGRAASRVVQECNNFFNIKTWSDTVPRCCVSKDTIFTTGEVDCYLFFETPKESFRAFCRKMHEKRYRHLLSLPRWDYRNWARGLWAAGYATDPVYANKLIGIIERYHLRRHDPVPVPHPYDEPGIDQVYRQTGVSGAAGSRVLQ